jgi:hypothetical protein
MSAPESEEFTIVSKLDAASSQLDCAIELWFLDKDPVSIHTLAAAAHQIVHDINRKLPVPKEMLFNTDLIKDEYRPAFIKRIKEPMNFFKHARDDAPDSSIRFSPLSAVLYILLTISGLHSLGIKASDHSDAFNAWISIHRSDWLTRSYKEVFEKNVPVESLKEIRRLKKHEFLHHFLKDVAIHKRG